jgi:hypothetical protein
VRRSTAYVLFAAGMLLTGCAAHDGQGATTAVRQSPSAVASALKAEGDSDPETRLRSQISAQIADAWKRSDFASLDATADEYVRTRARTYSGKWRLSIFHASLSGQLDIDWPAEWYIPEYGPCRCKIPNPAHYEEADRRWDEVRAKVDTWIKQNPKSPHAKVVLAQMLVNRAWFYRGTGYANTVLTEAWPLVAQYLAQSRQVLADRPEARMADPGWFDVMFFLAMAQSWDEPEVTVLIQDFRKFGRSYSTAYQSAATLMLPKWGGSYESVERFAQQAIIDNGNEGPDMYVRIYWNVVEAHELPETRADWPTMKRGFESILRKYPDPRNWNGMAMYACAAGDGTTFRQAMNHLGANLTPDSWTISPDQCKSRYGTDHL